MELTQDQALQKGIEAHKAGKVQEANRYYIGILKADPKHPAASHNLGVLTAAVGKVQEALSYFKTALEVNPNIVQFWLSYIDALIKLDRMDEARATFDQAKSHGVQGDGFDKLEKALKAAGQTYKKAADSNSLLQEKIKLLVSQYKQGKLQLVFEQVQLLTKQFPEVLILWNLMGATAAQIGQLDQAFFAFKKAIDVNPQHPDAYNNLGNVLKDQDKLDEAIKAYTKALSIKPDYADAYKNMGHAFKDQNKLDEAIKAYTKALSIKPNDAEAYYNLGNVINNQGKLDEAIEAYKKALSISPDYAEVYNNMGVALKDQDKLEEAIGAYRKALSIKPDYAEAHNNIGNALKDQRKLNEARDAYKKALNSKPDFAEAYFNMGNTLTSQGKFEEAVEAYSGAISIKPDYVVAHNNMGNALHNLEMLDRAIDAYMKALSIKSDYAEAYWNLSGTSENVSTAKNWLEKCLQFNPNHVKAKLTFSALLFYEGDKSNFNALVGSSFKDHEFMRSFKWVFNLPKLPTLHFRRWVLFDQMIDLSKKDRPFYEFGVWRGEAFKHLIKTFKRGYGFDTFEGLPEDWHNEKAGTYSSDGNIPKIEGGEFIVGKFEDTLPSFFAEPRPVASIINFDADLYSSTICALNFSKPVIDKYTILIFDEFIINKHWEQDEYKALEEFCALNDFTYEVLAISFFTKQVAVRLIGV